MTYRNLKLKVWTRDDETRVYVSTKDTGYTEKVTSNSFSEQQKNYLSHSLHCAMPLSSVKGAVASLEAYAV